MNIETRVEKLEDKGSQHGAELAIIRTELKYLKYIFAAMVLQIFGELILFLNGVSTLAG